MSHDLPLHNKVVLVAASEHKSAKLIAGLSSLGARVLSVPTIVIQEISDPCPVHAALDQIDQYTWIIFTSSYGVHHFLRFVRQRGIHLDRQHDLKICAVGPATAAALNQTGIEVSLVPEKFVAEGVLEALARFYGGLKNLAGNRILIPRAKEARDVLPRELVAAGARVDVVPCYESVLPNLDEPTLRLIRAKTPDLLLFTSSSTLTNFVRLMGEPEGKRLLCETRVAALGPITAETARALGKEVDILPKANTTASLLEAIAEYYG